MVGAARPPAACPLQRPDVSLFEFKTENSSQFICHVLVSREQNSDPSYRTVTAEAYVLGG